MLNSHVFSVFVDVGECHWRDNHDLLLLQKLLLFFELVGDDSVRFFQGILRVFAVDALIVELSG